jgi:Reverse transcriptase (RNA-dependent DNA polymerase)/GAG-pre-integrase domain/gag-polypeptide of LTR copia-type
MSAKDYANIPILAKDNYLSWKRLINGYFLTINAAELVQGSETRPGSGSNLDTAREDWDKRNRQAAGAIQLTIDETNAIHTSGIESDAPAQWKKLEGLHNNKTAGTRFNAMDSLFNIRMDSGEDLRSLITRAVAAMQRVKALWPGAPTAQTTVTVYPDPSAYTLETLDNELIIMTLIRALPQDYQHVRSALLIQTTLTLDTVRDAFLAEDNQRQHATQAAVPALKAFTHHTPPANYSTSASKPRETFPTTPGATCTYCGIANHTAEQCRKRIKNQRHAEKHYARANATVTSEIPTQSNVNQPSTNEPTAFAANASTPPIPPIARSNLNADTGASRIMMGDKNLFSSMRPHVRTIKLANGGYIYSKGEGEIIFQPWVNGKFSTDTVIFPNVLFAPDLQSNLISVLSLVRKEGYQIWINEQRMEFYLNGELRMTARIDENCVAHLDGRVITSELANAASTSILNRELWHRRLAHFHLQGLETMIRDDLVEDLRIDNASKPDPICVPCLAGKQHRAVHTTPTTRSDTLLHRISADLHGPIHTEALPYRALYWMPMVDEASGYIHVALLRKKSDALEAFQKFKALAETQTGLRVKHLRDDKGGEFMSTAFEKYCEREGIIREHTIRATPEQNGAVERVNRRISEAATAMLTEANLPPSFWGFAVLAYIHAANRCSSQAHKGTTPYQLWHSKKPSVKRLRVFGCAAYVHVQKDQRRALEAHTRKCVFVGYPSDRAGWMFWDSSARQLIYSDSAAFDEREFPGLGKQPETATVPLNLLPDEDEQADNIERGDDIPAPPAPPNVPVDALDDNAIPPVFVAGHPVPPVQPPAPAPAAPDPAAPRSRLAREVRALLDQTHYDRRPTNIPPKRNTRGRVEGTLAEPDTDDEDEEDHAHLAETLPDPLEHPFTLHANTTTTTTRSGRRPANVPRHAWFMPKHKKPVPLAKPEFVCIPIVDGVEFALNASTEPTTLAEALRRPDGDKYLESAIEEVRAHLENGTWKVVRLPRGKRAIGSRWVFKIKRTADGSIERYKGRIVAKGYSQREGIDYTETFAPTARFGALRTVIALAAIEDMELESVDISTAFLNGEIDAEVYMTKPEGVEISGFEGPEWVLQLLKGLYGIKQGPRLWSQKLHTALSEIGFRRLECDHSVFVYERDGVKMVVPVHVDDLVFASKSKEAIEKVKSDLRARFKIRDQGPTSLILGVQLERDRETRTVRLSQPNYIQSILESFRMQDCNGTRTPMDDKARLSSKMSPTSDAEKAEMKNIPYREAVGKLLYLSISTRPDISYAVGVLCRYNDNPGKEHWQAVKRVLRYLKATKHYKLTYAPSTISDEIFVTHSDADLGGNPDNARSTAGFVMSVGGGAVMWGSRLQRHVSLSSTESEYTTAAATGCEIIWMREFLDEIGYDISKASTLFLDSNSALQVAKNPEHQSTMKHVNRNYHWIRERVADGEIHLVHVPGTENVADIFTKPLAFVKFDRFRELLGLRP